MTSLKLSCRGCRGSPVYGCVQSVLVSVQQYKVVGLDGFAVKCSIAFTSF